MSKTDLTPAQAAALTPNRIELMRHATAWPKQYRNYFAADPNSSDHAEWVALTAVGIAEHQIVRTEFYPYDNFRVTPTGLAALREWEGKQHG